MMIEKMATDEVCRQCGQLMERQVTRASGGGLTSRLQCPRCKHYTPWGVYREEKDART